MGTNAGRRKAGSRVMPCMRKERPSQKGGWSRWKQQLNMPNLPRSASAWLRMCSRSGIGKFWRRWPKFGGSWREMLRERTQASSARRPLPHCLRPFFRPPNAATPAPCARAPRASVRSQTCAPFPCIPEQTADIAQILTLRRNPPSLLLQRRSAFGGSCAF
jgi:hypothetical protein